MGVTFHHLHQTEQYFHGSTVHRSLRMYSRTSSDTLKLRRLITSLRDTGSELAGQLENQSQSFFTGVQIVRSNNANTVRFDSDDESDYNEFNKHAESIREKRREEGRTERVQSQVIDCWEEENKRLEQLRRERLKQARDEEELQKRKLREAEEIRKKTKRGKRNCRKVKERTR